MRRLIDTVVLLLALAVVAEGWLTPGLLFPTVVSSASMAPRLRGPAWIVACPSCGLRFAIDRDAERPPAVVACPNCAEHFAPVGAIAKNGDRLLIDTASYSLLAPRRFEQAVVNDPDGSGGLVVKRVVGLPQETIEIRDGDIFADGQRAHKSLDELRRLAIGVNDDRHRPIDVQGNSVSRWRPDRPNSGWIQLSNGWRREPTADRGLAPDWLIYHNSPSAAPDVEPEMGSPVLDDYAYNSTESRRLEPVRDLFLRCRLLISDDDLFIIWISDGRDAFRCYVHKGGNCQGFAYLADLESPVDAADFGDSDVVRAPSDPKPNSWALLEFAKVDGQLLLAIDGKKLFLRTPSRSNSPDVGPPDDAPKPAPLLEDGIRLIRFERQATTDMPPTAPIAIGVYKNAQIEVVDLEVLRDIHYLPDATLGGGTQLAADEYFLLGDNCPRSIDSRSWARPGVSRDRFVGRVAGKLATDQDAW